MYPTISHLIYDLFGITPLPIQTFGFFVVQLFGCSIYSLELKEKNHRVLFSIAKKY